MTLPIDRLRDGSMTDAEIVNVAADTVSLSYEHGAGASARETLDALAARLRLVRLTDPRQTRARSTYWPGAGPDSDKPRNHPEQGTQDGA